MKVLKFGGTSVGSVESILNVKIIVESQTDTVFVVVSALGGITDKLIEIGKLAEGGNEEYKEQIKQIEVRHEQLIDAVIDDKNKKESLLQTVRALFEELKSICQGVYLIRELSQRTQASVVSYGERISSRIVATMIDGAKWFDSRDFIKTDGFELAEEETKLLLKTTFPKTMDAKVRVVPGFISSDASTGETTILGRGGSDYTASIIAATLKADVLEIWTDVDGFMTADPRVIPHAYAIKELSYVEAMELCNFGAKVIYPPTIYPVYAKNIPILIKNTFNPEAIGTIIRSRVDANEKAIKGISSISNTSLINISGPTMVGVVGFSMRIFRCLAHNNINVIMVSQVSSENSISIVVRDDDAVYACQCLNNEFEPNIKSGAMNEIKAERGLAAVAIVGDNMRHTPGIAGKLFGTLGRNGISVIACAQGGNETNISFVVEGNQLRKSLNVIHDSFFLSEYQELNLFITGVGTVGGSLIEQIHQQQEKLKREMGLKLNVVGIASGHKAMFNRDGLQLDNFREQLAKADDSNIKRLRDEVIGMNIFNSVFVDCTASAEVSSLYKRFLSHNINVVAANKIAASSDYENYSELKAIAQKRGVKFLFETNVGAGLPIIRTINDLRNSGDKILRIEAVLSGTLNFIFNKISAEVPFSETVRMAKAEGYSEPDPRIDLCGKDVMRKLVILTRESGYKINQEDVEAHLFIPQSFFDGTIDAFWKNLPTLDADFEKRRQALEQQEKRWRFVAKYEDGKACVSLQEVDKSHPFYHLEGSNNIVLLTTDRYKQHPMLIQGYGAGASVTAAGVFADIMSLAK
ncbi:MAG: bifunctional aspartate kinase/homoserine dehydrogenase I [Prevotellaceae bacterium]|nr:bifunctional aspartate kinase/homoserine dehydrogenase I [Prevotellaceae bacterium]